MISYSRLLYLVASAALALVPFVASSGDQPLSLKHGVYVRAASCKDAPDAEILTWDGAGFSGAHTSNCISQVTPQGKRFQVKTTCGALGDGSPSPVGSNYQDAFALNRLSSTRFELFKKNQSKATYRWCSAGTVK